MKNAIGRIAFTLLILAMLVLSLWLLSLIAPRLLYIVLAILILLLMVTIHEFGHYIAGKILKFKINEFAIGFGPKLFSYKRKNGEVFSIRLFPLGGFCAFEDENGEEEQQQKAASSNPPEPFAEYQKNNEVKKITSGSSVYGNSYGHKTTNKEEEEHSETNSNLKRFNEQAAWKRIIVLVAGGLFNLISAVIFSAIFIGAVGFEQPKVASVYEIPSEAGIYYNDLREGDIITAIDGKELGIMKGYAEMLASVKLGDSIVMTVIRDGKKEQVTLIKQEITIINKDGTSAKFEGFGFVRELNFKKVNVGYALKYAVPFTGKLAWSILDAFGGIFTGRIALTELSGPVGTIDAIAEVSAIDWRNIFLLLPLIAANLGLFNLFPIPALDGSKIVFAVIEWIRKKPINRNVEAYIHLVGMVLLLLFVIVIDVVSYIL